ncbi:HEWD family protein [Halobacteriaceae archaeon GCM10025711]
MASTIRVPEQRTCQECGRRERWDATEENWVVEDDTVGEVYCIHSWDITGEFRPVHG